MGLSRRKYALHRGVSHTAVGKAIDEGRITLLPDGTIDPVTADREWAENTNPEKQANGWKKAKGAPPPPPLPQGKATPARQAEKTSKAAAKILDPDPPRSPSPPPPSAELETMPETGIDFNQARTFREIYAAKTAELDFRERSGELVQRDEVKTGIFKVLTILRTHVMGIHSKCRLQADLPPHIVALIESLCRGGLEDAAKTLQELADGTV